MAASALDFSVDSNTLMLPVAHRRCVDTEEPTLEVDLEKRLLLHQGLEPISVLHLAFHTRGLNPRQSCARLFTPGARTDVSLAPGFSHQGLEPTSVLRLAFHTRGSNPHQSCAWLFTTGARTHNSLAPGCSVRHFTK